MKRIIATKVKCSRYLRDRLRIKVATLNDSELKLCSPEFHDFRFSVFSSEISKIEFKNISTDNNNISINTLKKLWIKVIEFQTNPSISANSKPNNQEWIHNLRCINDILMNLTHDNVICPSASVGQRCVVQISEILRVTAIVVQTNQLQLKHITTLLEYCRDDFIAIPSAEKLALLRSVFADAINWVEKPSITSVGMYRPNLVSKSPHLTEDRTYKLSTDASQVYNLS